MAGYGAQIFIKGTSFDVLKSMTPSYIVGVINTASGSASYDIPASVTLRAKEFSVSGATPGTPPDISISGNRVTWSKGSGWLILVYGD